MPYIIRGGRKLTGEVVLQGSKHSYAAIMVGAAMSGRKVVIKNFPKISDAEAMICLFDELGISVKKMKKGQVMINSFEKSNRVITLSSTNINKFRDSIYILALAPLFKKMTIPNCFGGCLLGKRPVTAQIQVLKKFGYSVRCNKNNIEIKKKEGGINKNNKIFLPKSVSVTKIAVLLAAYLANETILKNIAIEPNVHDLILFLEKMKVKIKFIASNSVSIKASFKKYNGIICHTLIPDRMEAVSFFCALLAAKGAIKIKNFDLNLIGDAKDILKKMGLTFILKNNDILAKCNKKISPVNFKTGYYPLTCTDMHPLMAVPLFVATGDSNIEETIFNKRWNYAKELLKMGARWKLRGNLLRIKGVGQLTGNIVHGHDIRCTAALIIAGLMAKGETVVTGENHLNRAYDSFVNKLMLLGADINYTDNKLKY